MTPPRGDQAWVAMPSSACAARSAGCVKYGCSSTWLTAGTTSVRPISRRSSSSLKFATPMARARPSARKVSIAFQAPIVSSKWVGTGWCSRYRSTPVEPEPAQARVEADVGGVEAVVADPQLGGDEDLVAGDAGAADALADLALVVVGGGRVDQPVAVTERRLDGGRRLLGRALEDAEAEGGDGDAVAQRQCRGRRGAQRRGPPVALGVAVQLASRSSACCEAEPGSAV